MLRKRWNDKSKSTDEIMAMAVEPAQFKIEPEAKKQRQSTIKRLFGSVKKLLPGSRRPITKAQPQTKAIQVCAFPTPQLIEKSAAMQEAELFLERIGSDWTVEQLRSRIDYLYKLVNDAFERAYMLSVKENIMPRMSPASKDHMTEIRNLQRMIGQRVPVAEPEIQEPVAMLSPSSLVCEVTSPEPVIETRRSNSVDNCVHQLPVLELAPPQEPRFSPPAYIPIDLTQGLVYNGVENKIDVNPIELAKASASRSEEALGGLLAQLEALEVTPATTQDIIAAAELSNDMMDESPVQQEPARREFVGRLPVSRHSAQDLQVEKDEQFGCERGRLQKTYSGISSSHVGLLIGHFEEFAKK